MARLTNAWNNMTNTENGAVAFKSTLNPTLDLFSRIGAIRTGTKRAWNSASMNQVADLFERAIHDELKNAIKVAFWARDIRGGAGEREAFRIMLRYVHKHLHATFLKIFRLVPEYGRWDDLIEFYYDESVVQFIGNQLIEDTRSEHPSLLAKWMPSENAGKESAKQAREWVIALSQLNFPFDTMRKYRKMLTHLRARINIVETKMSEKEWDGINYEHVPSRAAMLYRKAFQKHDADRYAQYLASVEKGEKKINSGTLYPYELYDRIGNPTTDAQWGALPNWITQDNGILVMPDVSASMSGRPMSVSVSLAIYAAERLTGVFKDTFMSFSKSPELVTLRGRAFTQRVRAIDRSSWSYSTDINKAFEVLLNVAKRHNLTDEDLPKTVVIISDMEFDAPGWGNLSRFDQHHADTNYEAIMRMYRAAGYTAPKLVFWNVSDRANASQPVLANTSGVMMISGANASNFKAICESKFVTPYDAMLDVINSDRYQLVAEALQ